MSRFSVKKPFTVVVGVIMVILLGVISFTNSTTDLLPEMELPYIIIYTTDIGASAQKVESNVTSVLESALGTTENLVNISSVSSDNLSLIILEYSEDTNMDSTMVEISSSIEQIKGSLDEKASTPIMMKMNPNMLPIMMASVDYEGKDLGNLSDFVNDELTMQLEKISGVAEVSASGLLKETIQITIDPSKVDDFNYRLIASVNRTIADQEREIRKGLDEVNDALDKINSGQSALDSTKSETISSLVGTSVQLQQVASTMISSQNQLTQYNAEKMAFQMVLTTIKNEMGLDENTPNDQLIDLIKEKSEPLKKIVSFYNEIEQDHDKLNAQTIKEIFGIDVPDGLPYEMIKPMLDSAIRTQFNIAEETSIIDFFNAMIIPLDESVRRVDDAITGLNNLDIQIQTAQAVVDETKAALELAGIDTTDIDSLQKQIEEGKLTAVIEFGSASTTLSSTKTTLESTKKQLEEGLKKVEEARDEALKAADISGILTPSMISNILTAENFSMPAGTIASNDESILLKVGDEFSSLDEISNLLLCNIEGIGEIYLKDICSIEIIDNSDELYTKVNGNDGVILSFQKSSTSSTATVCKTINNTFNELEEKYPGLHISTLFDQGVYIDMVVDSVLMNFLQGGALAILVLLLFLKDFKPTLVISLSIPISLLFAIVLMYFSNISLNIISLSGLALGIGMLVDNSIVVLENIYRRRAEGEGVIKASIQGAKQVSGSIIASTLTTVCVFLPIVFATGLAKQLFTDMGLTIAYSLLASLIVALTVVPMLCSKLLKKQKEIKHPLFDRFTNLYQTILEWSLSHRFIVLALTIMIFGFSCFQVTQMGMSLIPSMDSGQISLSVSFDEEQDLNEKQKQEVYNQVMNSILDIDGIETVGTTSSTGLMMSSMSSNSSQTIYIVEEENANQKQIVNDIHNNLSKMEGFNYEISTSNMDLSALGSSGISIKLYGDDLDVLRDSAIMLGKELEKIEGIAQVEDGQAELAKELRIVVNKNSAMEHGLTVAQVYMDLAGKLTTQTNSTTISLDNKSYPIVIVTAEEKINVNDLSEYMIETDNGDVRLSDIATFNDDAGMSSINRSNQRRYVTVNATISEGNNVALVAREVNKRIVDLKLPDGIILEMDGENESIMDTMWELVKMIALAIAFIYMIMVAQFQSLLSPFIVMFTIPLAFTGGILALVLCGQDLSIIAMLGFLILSGIVVNNGIVFIDTTNQLRTEGYSVKEALLKSGTMRLRPILMTAMTTILALITMALGIGSGSEMMQGMGIVVIGGLSYATILTLIIIPVLYSLMHKKPMKVIEEELDEEI